MIYYYLSGVLILSAFYLVMHALYNTPMTFDALLWFAANLLWAGIIWGISLTKKL